MVKQMLPEVSVLVDQAEQLITLVVLVVVEVLPEIAALLVVSIRLILNH